MSKNRVIGDRGFIPWYYPEDVKFFKNMTTGSAVIMGRVTYQSLRRPLPQRLNVVVSKHLNQNDVEANVVIKPSLPEALEYLESLKLSDCFIIGGYRLYKEGLKYADEILLSVINSWYKGDVYFPKVPRTFAINYKIKLSDKINVLHYTRKKLNPVSYFYNRIKYKIF